jgi:hypothetical protein
MADIHREQRLFAVNPFPGLKSEPFERIHERGGANACHHLVARFARRKIKYYGGGLGAWRC